MEVRAAQRLPATMRTAFNVAALAMAFADGCAAIRTGSEFLAHASFPKPEINYRVLGCPAQSPVSICRLLIEILRTLKVRQRLPAAALYESNWLYVPIGVNSLQWKRII